MPQNDAEDVVSTGPTRTPPRNTTAAAGTYKDAVNPVPTKDRLPTAQMPKGQDPLPFKLGPQLAAAR